MILGDFDTADLETDSAILSNNVHRLSSEILRACRKAGIEPTDKNIYEVPEAEPIKAELRLCATDLRERCDQAIQFGREMLDKQYLQSPETQGLEALRDYIGRVEFTLDRVEAALLILNAMT